MKVYSIFKSVTDDAATKNPAWAAFLIARQSSSEYSTLKAPKALLHFRTFLCTFFSTILSAETRRGCPERHSSEHNFALGTIQMPSFSVAVRLDVLHHDKASRNTEASHGRGTERPPRRHAARATCREPKLAAGFFAFRRRCKHSEYNSDVEDTETDQPRKAGHLNRLQCKVMTANVIRTSVNEGVQPRERRSDSAERRSTSRKRSKRSGYSEELRTTLPRD